MGFLKIHDLCKVYGEGENQVAALDHVSLDIKKEGNLQRSSGHPALVSLPCCMLSAV